MEWENHASENLQTSIERRHDVPDMVDEFVYSTCVSEEWTSRPPSQLGRHSVHFPTAPADDVCDKVYIVRGCHVPFPAGWWVGGCGGLVKK